MNITPMYCVTAINNLTGMRERISIISSDKDLINGLFAKQSKCKCHHKPYSSLKVEVYHQDMFDDK